MYSLSKKFDENGVGIGDDSGTNWLSDSQTIKRSKANAAAKAAADAAAKKEAKEFLNSKTGQAITTGLKP